MSTINAPQTIETRIPAGDGWAKIITAVSARAKSGHDWRGDFTNRGKLVDLTPGEVLVTVEPAGSRKRQSKRARMWVLLPDASWTLCHEVTGDEWAVELRTEARRFLELMSKQRIAEALEATLTGLRKSLKFSESVDNEYHRGVAARLRTEINSTEALLAEHTTPSDPTPVTPFDPFAGCLVQYTVYAIDHFMAHYWEGIRVAMKDLMAMFPDLRFWAVCSVPAEWGRTLVERADCPVTLPEGSFLRAGALEPDTTGGATGHVVAAPASDSFVIVGAACLPDQSRYCSNRAIFGVCDWQLIAK